MVYGIILASFKPEPSAVASQKSRTRQRRGEDNERKRACSIRGYPAVYRFPNPSPIGAISRCCSGREGRFRGGGDEGPEKQRGRVGSRARMDLRKNGGRRHPGILPSEPRFRGKILPHQRPGAGLLEQDQPIPFPGAGFRRGEHQRSRSAEQLHDRLYTYPAPVCAEGLTPIPDGRPRGGGERSRCLPEEGRGGVSGPHIVSRCPDGEGVRPCGGSGSVRRPGAPPDRGCVGAVGNGAFLRRPAGEGRACPCAEREGFHGKPSCPRPEESGACDGRTGGDTGGCRRPASGPSGGGFA